MFIRTVNKYEEKKTEAAGFADKIGGSVRMSVEGTNLLDAPSDVPDNGLNLGAMDVVVHEKNKLGCTHWCVRVMIATFAALFIIFIGGAVADHNDEQASSAMSFLGIIFLIVSICGCFIQCCACFQQPKGADE